MTVIAVASAKGSPGATIASLALAATWPRPVAVADIDPAGGDLIWRCRDPQGAPLDPDRGLLTLGAAARRGAAETSLGDHLQSTQLGFPVLVGIASPEQLTGLGAAWSQLPTIFAAHPGDVIADCGRVVPGSPAASLLLKADAVVFVVRPDLEGVAQLRERLRGMSQGLRLGQPDGIPVGVVAVASYRDSRVVDELQQLLEAHRVPATVLGILALDPKAAQVLSSGRFGDPRKTLLGRSARALAGRLSAVGHTAVGVG